MEKSLTVLCVNCRKTSLVAHTRLETKMEEKVVCLRDADDRVGPRDRQSVSYRNWPVTRRVDRSA